MPRSYSEKAFPHRILSDYDRDPQRGDDVKVLRRNTLERLDARNIDRKVGPDDGRYSKLIHDAAKTAAHYLGAPDDWTESKSGLLVREQTIIVYPERRTAGMLAAAEARMDRLITDRREREKAAAAKAKAAAADRGGVSNLSAKDRTEARRIAVAAFRLAYRNAGRVHYTQGSRRWEGIAKRLRYGDGRYPFYADCSSMFTWATWNALTSVGGANFRDVVNGASWRAGYTGTLLSHGERVSNRMPGDAVIYGRGFPGHHVAMVAEDTNMVYSHGSEAGPFYVRWNYRSDVMSIRRYI
jgi:hypothetical protein